MKKRGNLVLLAGKGKSCLPNLVYQLETGNYELQLTASPSVHINWLGSECGDIPRKQSYTITCELTDNGQLIITTQYLRL